MIQPKEFSQKTSAILFLDPRTAKSHWF